MADCRQYSSPLAAGLGVQVAATWDGIPLASSEVVDFSVRLDGEELIVAVDSPFYRDPPPEGPVGEMDGLWEYEVVELFLVGADGSYLEIELGPHGHYLVLLLGGVRQVSRHITPLAFKARVQGERWQGNIRLAISELPQPFVRLNAFAIHGQGDNRRYLNAFALPGSRPDFHQPHHFPAIEEL